MKRSEVPDGNTEECEEYCGYVRIPFSVEYCDLDTFTKNDLPDGWSAHEHYFTPINNILIFEVENIENIHCDIKSVCGLIRSHEKDALLADEGV